MIFTRCVDLCIQTVFPIKISYMHGFLQASSPLLFSIFVSVLFLLLHVGVTNKYGTNANTNRKGSNEKKKMLTNSGNCCVSHLKIYHLKDRE